MQGEFIIVVINAAQCVAYNKPCKVFALRQLINYNKLTLRCVIQNYKDSETECTPEITQKTPGRHTPHTLLIFVILTLVRAEQLECNA